MDRFSNYLQLDTAR